MTEHRRHVVIVGCGFGGLECAKALRGREVDVTIVDRRDYHLFTPLLYQVASCLLNPSEIAAPIRKIFRGAANVRYRQDTVTRIDTDAQRVELASGAVLEYDACVVATGSVTNYYGNRGVEEHALGLKDLGQALALRNHVLECFEQATTASTDASRQRLLTFCIVGGGPTGVEYAGALAEFVRLVVPKEYPELSAHEVRIVLLEGGERLVPMLKPRLGEYTRAELVRLGVEVRLRTLVDTADDLGVVLHDGTELPTATMVWTAGVQPNAPNGVPTDAQAARRMEVDDHFLVHGTTSTYAIGDAAAGRGPHGEVLPMVSPPAMQAGRYVAAQILGRGSATKPFRYRDKGTLATIGRTKAVGQVGPLSFTGFVGWVVWLAVHLWYLIGFENRVRVLMRWAWYYVRLDRPVRIVVRADERRTPDRLRT